MSYSRQQAIALVALEWRAFISCEACCGLHPVALVHPRESSDRIVLSDGELCVYLCFFGKLDYVSSNLYDGHGAFSCFCGADVVSRCFRFLPQECLKNSLGCQKFLSYVTVMSGWMMLGEVVRVVEFSGAPVEAELFLEFSVA